MRRPEPGPRLAFILVTCSYRSRECLFASPRAPPREIDFAGGARGRITCLSTPPFYGRFTLIGDQGWVEVQEGGNVDKGIPSSFVHCGPDGNRVTHNYDHTNTVRMNFEAWADAVEGKAPYRFTTEQLLGNIRILDAVTQSAAAGGKPIAT